MKYVVADLPSSLWGHIFNQKEGEVMTRFAFDLEENRLVSGLIVGGRSGKGVWWTPMSQDLLDDLEDSLKNANPDALDSPEDWGLVATDTLPEWATPASPAPGR